MWYSKGDRTALVRFLGDHPDWEAAAWPVHLKQLADAQQFEVAAREAAGRYHISLNLPTPDPAAATPGSPGEDRDAARAFVRNWTAGNTIGVRRVLEEAAANADTLKTSEYYRLRAALAVHDANWPEAWARLRQAILLDHPDAGL